MTQPRSNPAAVGEATNGILKSNCTKHLPSELVLEGLDQAVRFTDPRSPAVRHINVRRTVMLASKPAELVTVSF